MRALIADDEATNRIVLKRLLTQWGYEVVVADNGKKAWEVLSGPEPPRLAVLDWLMPELDGVDICRMLSQRTEERYIYTVLVSHKSSMDEMASALDAGADDFIAKPVDPVELRSRLGVAKRMLAYDDRLAESSSLLKQYAMEMEQLAEERASQLVHADRMATLGMLSAGVAHEVNNPTTFISGNIQTIERFWRDLAPALDPDAEGLDPKLAAKMRFIKEEMPGAINGIHSGVKRIAKIVKGLKDYSRHKPGDRGTCDANECASKALDLVSFQTSKKVTVSLNLAEDLPSFSGDGQQIEQVLVNLLVNASHALEDRDNPQIELWTLRQDDRVLLGVRDNGPGVPEDLIERIWNPFFTTKTAGKGTGLGLSICRRIAEDHGGQLTVRNLESGGAEFTLSIPAKAEGVAA